MAIKFITFLWLAYVILLANSSALDESPSEDYEFVSVNTDDDDIDQEFPDPEEQPSRQKRQAFDAMQRSLTNNPVGKIEYGKPTFQGGYFQDKKNFGGRVGGSAGAKVWESGRQSVGLGVAGQANVGLHNGRPYANNPSIGAGLGYQNGRFSASAGVGRLRNGPTTYGVGLGYRFKRSMPGQDEYLREQQVSEEFSEKPKRNKRQTLVADAMQRSLTTNPLRQIEFGKPTLRNPYFDNLKNFGGRVGGSAGVKVLEHGRHNLGLGVAGQTNLGLARGRLFANTPEIASGLGYRNGPLAATAGAGLTRLSGQTSTNYGAKVGYQRGPWSATVDAVHNRIQGRGSTNLGAGLGYQRGNFGANLGVQHNRAPFGRTTNFGAGMNYRWKRSSDELDDEEPSADHQDISDEEHFEKDHVLRKRQISDTASRVMDKSITNFPMGQLEHSKDIDNRWFQNRKNFGGRAVGSVGTKVWEKNNRSVGVGLAADAQIGVINGRPFSSSPRVGAAVGYRHGPFSASLGADRARDFRGRSNTNYGVRFGYTIPRGKRSIDEMYEIADE